MKNELLSLSEDQTKLLDRSGKVVYTQAFDESGNEFFTTEEQVSALGKKRVCVGFEDQEYCVKWGSNDICVKLSSKKVCINYEWQD